MRYCSVSPRFPWPPRPLPSPLTFPPSPWPHPSSNCRRQRPAHPFRPRGRGRPARTGPTRHAGAERGTAASARRFRTERGGTGRRRLGRGRCDRCRHRPRRQRRPRRAQRGRHPGPGHRRHHRRQRLLHHPGDAHLDQAGDVDPRDPSVGQRGHPPAHGRPGHARPQRRGEGRHRPHRATVRAGPGEVRGARLRRRQHHVRRPADEHFHLYPGRHFRRRPGHVRPRRSGARCHRPDAGRRQPGGGDQHGAQASDPGLPRLPCKAASAPGTAIAARPTFPVR